MNRLRSRRRKRGKTHTESRVVGGEPATAGICEADPQWVQAQDRGSG